MAKNFNKITMSDHDQPNKMHPGLISMEVIKKNENIVLEEYSIAKQTYSQTDSIGTKKSDDSENSLIKKFVNCEAPLPNKKRNPKDTQKSQLKHFPTQIHNEKNIKLRGIKFKPKKMENRNSVEKTQGEK